MPTLHFYDAEDRPWPNQRLSTASILGHVTSRSIRIWVRMRDEGTYYLIVSRTRLVDAPEPASFDAAGKVVRSDAGAPIGDRAYEVQLRFGRDNTAVVDVGELEPDTEYHYAVVSLSAPAGKRWELGYEEDLTFRTDPRKIESLAFGLISCHMPYDGENLANMDMFASLEQALTDARARMLVAAGDQVYVDGNRYVDIWRWLRKVKSQGPTDADMISWYRDIYRGYWGMLPLRRVFRSTPTYMIWDDHEILDGWGSYTDDELSDRLDTWWEWENKGKNLKLARRMFEAAKQVYFEYQHSHNPPTPVGQWDYSFDCAPVASFFVFDMRGQRSYGGAAGQRILGVSQRQRFEKWLSTATGSVLFVVSPVPIVHARSFVVNHLDLNLLGLADDLRDEWEHDSNWAERNKVLHAIFDASHKSERPVVFLSGDVHIAGAFKLFHLGYPKARVHQLTSSGITYAGLSELMRRGLQLTVAKRGSLGDEPKLAKEDKFYYETLLTYHRNHFAIVRAEGKGVSFDVFGAHPESGAVSSLRRVMLSPP